MAWGRGRRFASLCLVLLYSVLFFKKHGEIAHELRHAFDPHDDEDEEVVDEPAVVVVDETHPATPLR